MQIERSESQVCANTHPKQKVFASDEFEFEFRPIMISCFAEIIGTTIGEKEKY